MLNFVESRIDSICFHASSSELCFLIYEPWNKSQVHLKCEKIVLSKLHGLDDYNLIADLKIVEFKNDETYFDELLNEIGMGEHQVRNLLNKELLKILVIEAISGVNAIVLCMEIRIETVKELCSPKKST
ncbi:MAG: hypothetical protein ACRCV6_10340 [Formosimonas sp.]